jgi:hypothetical protein
MQTRRLTLGALAVVAAAAVIPVSTARAASPTTASAPSASHRIHFVLPRGAAHAASPATTASANLLYSGGPVEQAGTTNYAIFWEPSLTASANSVSPTYNSLITRFLSDVGGSSLYGVATQYSQVSGGVTQNIVNSSTFGGSYVDTSIYPGPALTDVQIQAEVTKAMAAKGWTAGIGHEFFVFTAKNEVSCAGVECSNAVFCAYHSSFTSGSQEVLYADQPYTGTTPVGCTTPSSPNNDLDADSTINVVSHELMETVTDPSVGDGRYAWQDSGGQEIGDKCNFVFGPTDAAGADLTANGHPYIVQSEWSNRVSGCSMS